MTFLLHKISYKDIIKYTVKVCPYHIILTPQAYMAFGNAKHNRR